MSSARMTADGVLTITDDPDVYTYIRNPDDEEAWVLIEKNGEARYDHTRSHWEDVLINTIVDTLEKI